MHQRYAQSYLRFARQGGFCTIQADYIRGRKGAGERQRDRVGGGREKEFSFSHVHGISIFFFKSKVIFNFCASQIHLYFRQIYLKTMHRVF